MKVLFSKRVHARILSIDTSSAEALDGVVLVLTARDVPVNEYGLIYNDQPVLCGPGSDKEGTDIVRFEGDQVALVIAESAEIAEKALSLIKVDYEDLPVVKTLGDALKENATLLHPGRSSNIFHHNIIRHGNVEEAFMGCDVIVEGEYQTPVQEHAYLQPEAGVAFLDDEGRITVVVGGQWTHEDQEQIAHALSLEPEKVRVIYPAIGGAFGGREDMSIQIILGLAVLRLHEKGIDRPVKIVWSREESIVGHAKRHAYSMKAKWGATKDGKILAAQCEIWANGGAYAYTSTKVLGNATLLASGPYEIPNVATDAYAVYTMIFLEEPSGVLVVHRQLLWLNYRLTNWQTR
jgi:CO/xanthine dehydrogenase Mo-binding subunit